MIICEGPIASTGQSPPPQQNRPAELLLLIAEERDQAAFSELFQIYAPKIKGYMMRQGADEATAEEVAQEALSRVWLKASTFSAEKGSPASWIFRIARNLRIDRIRRERIWQEIPQEHDEQPDDSPLPDQIASENERAARLSDALSVLPAEQLEIVTLSYIEGLSHSEISEKLDVPLGTIKSRMRLAYQKLKSELDDL